MKDNKGTSKLSGLGSLSSENELIIVDHIAWT